jgi:hypothetical protein
MTEITVSNYGYSLAKFVAAISKKAEVPEFDSRWCGWDFY